MKKIMDNVLVERHEARHEILLQLDDVQLQVNLMDHKINLLAEKVVGLDLSKLDYPQPQVLVGDDHPPLV
jgi:hypothetical protein